MLIKSLLKKKKKETLVDDPELIEADFGMKFDIYPITFIVFYSLEIFRNKTFIVPNFGDLTDGTLKEAR